MKQKGHEQHDTIEFVQAATRPVSPLGGRRINLGLARRTHPLDRQAGKNETDTASVFRRSSNGTHKEEPAREAGRSPNCRNNLKHIALALHCYADAHGTFPPAYVTEMNGKPMHSWRTLILPFLELQGLYQAYRFDEPWDGPNNRKLANAPGGHLPVYRCHCGEATDLFNETHFFAVVGPQTLWPGGKGIGFDDITDETRQTLLLIEVHGLGVEWMEPRDISFGEALEILGQAGESQPLNHDTDDRFFSRKLRNLRCVAFLSAAIRVIAN